MVDFIESICEICIVGSYASLSVCLALREPLSHQFSGLEGPYAPPKCAVRYSAQGRPNAR